MMYSRAIAGSILALGAGNALAGGVSWAGLNIAGMDFGCTTDGTCDVSKVVVPLTQYHGQDGAAQMKHFTQDDKFNAFRLPVGWQYLVNGQVGGKLDENNFAAYDALMKACLDTGAHCIIDIHNYARWDNAIIGQGGPSNDQFADLWSQLMTHYADQPNVVVGMVNEPHDIPDMDAWAASCQAVVTAVRKAGATKHTILLPGTGYTSAGSFVSSGSAQSLSAVKNPDGSVDNLVFDVHKYLDSDNSGTHTECIGDSIDDAFKPLAEWLKQNKRMALLSEIGGGSNDQSCMTHVCSAVNFLNENSDVYLGYLGWGAGSFDQTYMLSLTPNDVGGTMQDQPLLTKCFTETFGGGSGTTMPTGNGTDTSGSDTTGSDTTGSDTSGSGAAGSTPDSSSSAVSVSSAAAPTTMATSYVAASATTAAGTTQTTAASSGGSPGDTTGTTTSPATGTEGGSQGGDQGEDEGDECVYDDL